MEQLTNLLTRLAVQQHRSGDQAGRDDSMRRARGWIARLQGLPKNSERLAVMGSAAKRLAFITGRAAARKKLLEESEAMYGEAAQFAEQRDNRPDPYPLLNAIVIRWLLKMQPAATLLAEARTCEAIVEQWKDADEYWKCGSRPDYLLTVGLLKGALNVDEIAEAYRSALQKTGKKVEQLSVIEHIEFIAEMLKNDKNPARKRLSIQAADLASKLG
jgi:hypothetical protein